MAHSPPPIPPEQRSGGPDSPAGRDSNTDGDLTAAGETKGLNDRRDRVTKAPDGQPGDAGVNTDEQGRFGDIKQNTTHQGYQQDR